MKKHIASVLFLLMALMGCQKIVDSDKLFETGEKVFISGYLAPQDTVLKVHVSRILPVVGTTLSVDDDEANLEKFLIQDAQVRISDTLGNSVQLLYAEEGGNYLADASALPIVAGQRYFLRVVVDGLEYGSSCQIPTGTVEIHERVALRENDFGSQEVDLNLIFNDILGERNFYVLGGFATTTVRDEGQEPVTNEFRVFFEGDEFLTDVLEDGATLSERGTTTIWGDIGTTGIKVKLQVANVEEILFQNLRSSNINADAGDNPFIEYSIAPDNILDEGAVGVFAGYQITEKIIDIEL